MAIVGNTELDNHQLLQIEGHIILGPEMCAAVGANPHLLPQMIESIRTSVQWSFNHPETKMRCITGSEIQRRSEVCLAILEQAYAEQGFRLHQLKDALPALLVDVLMQDADGNDILDGAHQKGRWTAGGDDRPDIELTDDEEATLSGDLTDGVEPDPFTEEELATVDAE